MPDTVKPLWVYPWPVNPEDVRILREAKAKLDTDFKVVPQEAKVGCPGRVLALRVPPDFIVDHALIKDMNNSEAVGSALEWAITYKNDSRASSVLLMLKRIFGAGLTEVDSRQLARENISKNMNLGDDRKKVRFK